MTGTSAARDENRFTESDRATIRARMDETFDNWSRPGPYTPVWADVETMQRIACHAIGCTEADLRASELAEIRGGVLRTLGLEES